MKKLKIKATFDNNVTLLIFVKKNNMMEYQCIRSTSKAVTGVTFDKELPDCWDEIPYDILPYELYNYETQSLDVHDEDCIKYFSELLTNSLGQYSTDRGSFNLVLKHITIF